MNTRSPIYKPKGAALEYSPLALNHYGGCTFGCKYCYAGSAIRKKRADYHSSACPKKNIIERTRQAVDRLPDYPTLPRILLSFLGDIYQHEDSETGLTREILKILAAKNLDFTVLTKGGMAASRDFDILQDAGASFGTSLVFINDLDLKRFEPNAASFKSSAMAIIKAKKMGIPTWMSIEPVIDPAQALQVILAFSPVVDEFKVGKINHVAGLGKGVDWYRFNQELLEMAEKHEINIYLKDSLKKYLDN